MILETASSPLAAWESFYVIVGSSGGALIGLQFVVIALVAEIDLPRSHGTIRAFATPTIVHFSAALLISATMSAPWPTIADAGIVLGIIGIAGVLYAAINARRATRQTAYAPVLEDWIWHTIFPAIAYAALGIAAVVLRAQLVLALFIVAAAALLLLFIGIHNAWDTVVYMVIDRGGRSETQAESTT